MFIKGTDAPAATPDPAMESLALAASLGAKMDAVVTNTKSTRDELGMVRKDLTDLRQTDTEVKSRIEALEKKANVVDEQTKATLAEYQKAVTRQIELAHAQGRPSGAISIPGVDEGKEKFSFCKMLYADQMRKYARMGDAAWEKYAPYEKRVLDATRTEYAKELSKYLTPDEMKAALGTDVDTAGGYLVPSQVMVELIPLLRAQSVVLGLARVLDGLAGSEVRIPKQSGGATHYWGAQNSAMIASLQSTAEVTMRPHQSYVFCQMSQRLVALSNPSVEAMVREDIALIMALGQDLGFIEGTGFSNQPLGLVNQPGINTVTTIGTPTNADYFYNMIAELENDNALRGNLAWAWHPRTKQTLRKIKLGTGAALTYATYAYPELDQDRFLGYPCRQTTQIATNLGNPAVESRALFANWTDVVVGNWAGLRVQATDVGGDAFAKDQIWIKAVQDVDIALRHGESVCLGSGIKA